MKKLILYPFGTNHPIWEQIENDLAKDDVLDYNVDIAEGGKVVSLSIDIDLGGGFEGGFASTVFSAKLPRETGFRFAIHKEDFIDEIGKFFGMQDVIIGFEKFDEKMIVKTNDEARVKQLFGDQRLRDVLLELERFTFGIHTHQLSGSGEPFLEMVIDDAVTDVHTLRNLYSVFFDVLVAIDG